MKNRITGYKPKYLMYGIRVLHPFDLKLGVNLQLEIGEIGGKGNEYLEISRKNALEKVLQWEEKNIEYRKQSIVEKEFKPKDLVLINKKGLFISRKIDSRWQDVKLGPWVVVAILDPGKYLVQSLLNPRARTQRKKKDLRVVNIKYLMPCFLEPNKMWYQKFCKDIDSGKYEKELENVISESSVEDMRWDAYIEELNQQKSNYNLRSRDNKNSLDSESEMSCLKRYTISGNKCNQRFNDFNLNFEPIE